MFWKLLALGIGIISLLLSRAVKSCDQILPVVDLGSPDADVNLVDAFQSFGFSYVKGHNVNEDVIKKAEDQAKEFFRLPERVKRSRERPDRPKPRGRKTKRGYTAIREEQLDVSERGKRDLKEVLDVGFLNKTSKNIKENKRHYLGDNVWPPNSEDLENSIESYAENSAMVAKTVLQLLAEGLGAKGAFDDVFNEDALQVQRLTKYPPTNDISDLEQGEIGSGVHTDFGGITVLHADGPGLQVLRPNQTSLLVEYGTFSPELEVPHSNEWIEVESRPGHFIVMGGEALQRLSNGLIFAAKHKVEMAPGDKNRHSLAFFFDPRPDAILEPLKAFRTNGRPIYKSKLAGHKGVKRD